MKIRPVFAPEFQKVKIVEETQFPVKYMSNDPTAKAVIQKANISPEDIEDIEDSVSSVKVFGIKPVQ